MSVEDNLKKLNEMVNEIKGMACISRASLQDKKNFDIATGELTHAAKNFATEINKLKRANALLVKKLENKMEKVDKIYDFLKCITSIPIE